MAIKTAKQPATPAEIRRRKELAKIHILKKDCEALPGFDYEDILQVRFRVNSAADLGWNGRKELIEHLDELLGGKHKSKSFGSRPRNMNKGGSRADQLGKIEALLTIGGLSWTYADAIAKQMRLADKTAWVKDGDLYKIITALRKKAQKEGWDLSGEKK